MTKAEPVHLYAYPFAPNPMKPIILIGEKSMDVQISIVQAGNFAAFRRLNPGRRTPVLVLEGNRVVTESLAICRYLDEVSGPRYLFGNSLDERTDVTMWERRAELELFNESASVYHNIHPMFRQNIPQSMEVASRAFAKAGAFISTMGGVLETRPFLAGDGISAADITAYIGFFWLTAMGVLALEDTPDSIKSWANSLSRRPSFYPLLEMADTLRVTEP